MQMEQLAIRSHVLSAHEDFTTTWLAGQLSSNTSRAYSVDIRQFLEFLGHDDLSAVRRQDLFSYRQWLNDQYAPATVNRKLSAVRQLMTEAVRHGVIDRSPADGLKGHRSEGNFSPTKAPTEEQVHALLDSLNGDTLPDMRDKAMLYCMLALGLRRHEIVQLRVNSFAEEGEHVVVTVMGKGHKRRKITVAASAFGALQRLAATYKLDGDDYVFQEIKKQSGFTLNGGYHLSGKPLTANGVYHIVKKRFESAGIEGCSPHSCRRFFLTYLIRHGASIYDAQKAAGHADPRTTERYIQADNDLDSSAAKYVEF